MSPEDFDVVDELEVEEVLLDDDDRPVFLGEDDTYDYAPL